MLVGGRRDGEAGAAHLPVSVVLFGLAIDLITECPDCSSELTMLAARWKVFEETL